ncbi:MAG: hypothetical protein HY805_02925 [Nitrospirae bacterium]|nr:hypothetical protein [Nitrospirota bacterium]
MKNVKKKRSISSKKLPLKYNYYQEIIVQPAEKLLKALMEAEEKEKKSTPRVRETVTH